MSKFGDAVSGLYFRKSRQVRLDQAIAHIETTQQNYEKAIARIGTKVDSIQSDIERLVGGTKERQSVEPAHSGTTISWRREQTYFSQFGEDIIVEHLYPTFTNGRYLDIGCFHPYVFSNTAKLHFRGWSGVNIDANPRSIELFGSERPGDINLNLVVGSGPTEEVPFYILDVDGASNTRSLPFAEAQARTMNTKLLDPIIVRKVTLSEVIRSHFVDQIPLYLNIDAEVYDLDVLQSGDSIGKLIAPL